MLRLQRLATLANYSRINVFGGCGSLNYYSTSTQKSKKPKKQINIFGKIKIDRKNLKKVEPIQEKPYQPAQDLSVEEKLQNFTSYDENKTLLNKQDFYYSPTFAKLGTLTDLDNLSEEWGDFNIKGKKEKSLETHELDIPIRSNIEISKNSSGLSTPFPRTSGNSPHFVAVPSFLGGSHLRGMLNNKKNLNVIDVSVLHLIEKFIKVQIANDCMKSMSIHTTTPGVIHCTGMDFKSLYEERENSVYTVDYIKRLTKMFYLISCCPKPFISIQDGLSVGAGTAFSANAGFRVVTENSIFSVPDCAMGFFPNAGNLKFLARLQDGVGLYLALTGRRLRGPELMQTGIGNFYVHTSKVKLLDEALSLPFNHIEKLLINMSTYTECWDLEVEGNPTHIDQYRDAIKRCFQDKSTVEEVIQALEKEQLDHPENKEWSKRCLSNISKSSPVSIKLTMRLYNDAIKNPLSTRSYFEQDYRITMALINDQTSDLWEGIKSSIITPSKPNWKYSTLDKVTDAMIQEIIDYKPPVEQQLKLRKLKSSNIYFEDIVDNYIDENSLVLRDVDKRNLRTFSGDPLPDEYYHNLSIHYSKAQSQQYDDAENINNVIDVYLKEGINT